MNDPLTEPQIRQLMAAAMAYDNRRPGDANVAAWMEAARRSRWDFDAALDAIHAHYASSTEFLMPGHITAALRNLARLPERYRALPPAASASEEARKRVLAMIKGKFGLPRDVRREGPRAQRRSAEDAAAREAARAELEALRVRREQQEAGQ